MVELGRLHASGSGVKQSAVDAYVWTALAANQGHLDARAAHDDMAKALSAAQRAEADKRVDGWRPKREGD